MGYLVYAGGYTQPILQGTGETIPGHCPGINAYLLSDEGEIKLLQGNKSTPNPSYLILNREGTRLYCVNELKTFNGDPSSAVSCYRIGDTEGTLTFMNMQPTGGTDGCFLSLAQDDRFLLVGNYGSGSCAVFPIDPDGSIAPASCILPHDGKSIDGVRQSGPHVHHITQTPDGSGVLAVDLGQDKILHYKADWEHGSLIAGKYPSIEALPGQGPRHLVWNREGNRLYVITEMSGEINVYAPSADGKMEMIQRISAAAEGQAEHGGAAIRIHPSGQFLYVSLRTTNMIGVFRIRPDGTLEQAAHRSCHGRAPRDIAISPCGRFLLVANQDSGNISVFTLDTATGAACFAASAAAPSVTTVTFAK